MLRELFDQFVLLYLKRTLFLPANSSQPIREDATEWRKDVALRLLAAHKPNPPLCVALQRKKNESSFICPHSSLLYYHN